MKIPRLLIVLIFCFIIGVFIDNNFKQKPEIAVVHKNGKFGCAIDCMDGRVQDAVKKYIQKNYDVEFVDTVTEAGPNKILAENIDLVTIGNIKKRVDISLHHHDSKIIAIVGHYGCAGNPAGKDQQISHLKEAKKHLEELGVKQKIILLWIGEDFQTVEKID